MGLPQGGALTLSFTIYIPCAGVVCVPPSLLCWHGRAGAIVIIVFVMQGQEWGWG
ncbi:hypothetical protein SCLCIDRAFT_28062 [Scleroderma citrinum Foug A]|uniref:Uncharacterized protein n=1 Tax=Scleroderma citrinum Foug A TaxID=1036808 RepID=A0A0C3A151_9AGAM|nr:hypothetical protein SCLCIDRAFT_28062 [Scleroderma citrinum Foug A]